MYSGDERSLFGNTCKRVLVATSQQPSEGEKTGEKMATTCSDHAVLAGLFLAAYSGNLADVKSALKNNALSADVADPNKVGGVCVNQMYYPASRVECGSRIDNFARSYIFSAPLPVFFFITFIFASGAASQQPAYREGGPTRRRPVRCWGRPSSYRMGFALMWSKLSARFFLSCPACRCVF